MIVRSLERELRAYVFGRSITRRRAVVRRGAELAAVAARRDVRDDVELLARVEERPLEARS